MKTDCFRSQYIHWSNVPPDPTAALSHRGNLLMNFFLVTFADSRPGHRPQDELPVRWKQQEDEGWDQTDGFGPGTQPLTSPWLLHYSASRSKASFPNFAFSPPRAKKKGLFRISRRSQDDSELQLTSEWT